MPKTKQLHQKLIQDCKLNKAKAQMQLYKAYCSAMHLIANRYVKDRFLAEDIMQESFIKAFKNIDKFEGKVSFGAWLKRIVINRSIDELKKNKILQDHINEEVLNIVEEENDWEVEGNVTSKMIIEVINNQKEKYRLVLTLFLIEGYDHKEISQILSITEVTSRTNLARGKKLVREHLKKMNYAGRY